MPRLAMSGRGARSVSARLESTVCLATHAMHLWRGPALQYVKLRSDGSMLALAAQNHRLCYIAHRFPFSNIQSKVPRHCLLSLGDGCKVAACSAIAHLLAAEMTRRRTSHISHSSVSQASHVATPAQRIADGGGGRLRRWWCARPWRSQKT